MIHILPEQANKPMNADKGPELFGFLRCLREAAGRRLLLLVWFHPASLSR